MRIGFVTSVVFHAVLITLGILGLHGAEELQPVSIEAISVDLVPIEEVASIRAGSEQSTVIETPVPAVVDTPEPAQLAERPGATETDQPNPEETAIESPAPTVETAPEPEPVPEPQPEEPPPADPEPAPEPQPQEPPPEVQPDPVLAAEPEPAETPAEPAPPVPVMQTASLELQRARAARQQATEPADQISDIINTEDSRGTVTGSGGQAAAGRPTGQAARLTQSELGALIAQMRRCWNPTLAERNDGVIIRLMVSMNTDGTVSGMPQILSDATGILGISARTAARKVMQCGPFDLPDDKYDHWRQIDVTLDASQSN